MFWSCWIWANQSIHQTEEWINRISSFCECWILVRALTVRTEYSTNQSTDEQWHHTRSFRQWRQSLFDWFIRWSSYRSKFRIQADQVRASQQTMKSSLMNYNRMNWIHSCMTDPKIPLRSLEKIQDGTGAIVAQVPGPRPKSGLSSPSTGCRDQEVKPNQSFQNEKVSQINL